jgi:hypothetical protein
MAAAPASEDVWESRPWKSLKERICKVVVFADVDAEAEADSVTANAGALATVLPNSVAVAATAAARPHVIRDEGC